MTMLRSALLLLLSLLLACLSNPGMPLPFLAWLALVPLFYALEYASRRTQTILVGVWGVLWWAWSIDWLWPAAIQFIGLAPWLALLVWSLICLSLSLPYWLIGALWRTLQFKRAGLTVLLRALLFSVAVALVETVMPASVASGQYVYPKLIQVVDIGGVPLLLFAVVLVNLLLTQALIGLVAARAQRRRLPLRSVYCIGVALMVPCLLLLYGTLRCAQINRLPTTAIAIGWVQPNLQRSDTIDSLLAQTWALAAANPALDLIVWPEFPPAFSWSDNDADRARVNTLLRAIDKPLLLNSGYVYAVDRPRVNNGGPTPYYNAAQLISAQGKLLGSYYKERLVPFFEFLPYEQTLPSLRQFFPNSLMYVPGRNNKPIHFKNHIDIAPLICYEMIFANLAQRQIDNNATLFINLSNDGWFGDSRGSISHLALALFRSVEHHRPWLRVTNSGIGIATDANGELMPATQSRLRQRVAGVVQLRIPHFTSFYSDYPRAFFALAAVVLLLGLLAGAPLAMWRARQKNQ